MSSSHDLLQAGFAVKETDILKLAFECHCRKQSVLSASTCGISRGESWEILFGLVCSCSFKLNDTHMSVQKHERSYLGSVITSDKNG